MTSRRSLGAGSTPAMVVVRHGLGWQATRPMQPMRYLRPGTLPTLSGNPRALHPIPIPIRRAASSTDTNSSSPINRLLSTPGVSASGKANASARTDETLERSAERRDIPESTTVRDITATSAGLPFNPHQHPAPVTVSPGTPRLRHTQPQGTRTRRPIGHRPAIRSHRGPLPAPECNSAPAPRRCGAVRGALFSRGVRPAGRASGRP